MTDIYGLPDTTGRKEGDTWTTTLPDGRTVVNTIPAGNGNQTVDQVITNPDGSTTNSRVAGNGLGGWQRWNDDSSGTSSYAGKDTQGSEVYGQHFNPGASTSGRPSHEFGMSSDYKTTATASYDQQGNRIGTDLGVANKNGLYDNVHVDNYGNKTFSATTRDGNGGLVSTFTGQIDSDGYGWRTVDGNRWEVAPDSQGKPVLTRTQPTDTGVHLLRMDESGKLTDEFRGNKPGEWYRDTITTDAEGKTTISRLDVHLGVTVYDIDGNVLSRQKPADKRTRTEKIVDTTYEVVYGAGRAFFGLTDLGAAANVLLPGDPLVTSDDIAGETVESLKPLFKGDGHERWQALQAMVAGTNTDELAEDSTVSITKGVLTAATFLIPGPKGLGAFKRGGRAGEEQLINKMVGAGKSEAEIIDALRELRALQETLNPRRSGEGEWLTAEEVLAAIDNARTPRTGGLDGAGRREGDPNASEGSHLDDRAGTDLPGEPGRHWPVSVVDIHPPGISKAEWNRRLELATPPASHSGMEPISPDGSNRWDDSNLTGRESSGAKGFVGDALTRAKLELDGYEIIATGNEVNIIAPGVGKDGFKPDFIARTPDGKLVFVESKGWNADYQPNQRPGYTHYQSGDQRLQFEPKNVELRKRLEDAGFDPDDVVVDRVETIRWNGTGKQWPGEVAYRPSDAVLAKAAEEFSENYSPFVRKNKKTKQLELTNSKLLAWNALAEELALRDAAQGRHVQAMITRARQAATDFILRATGQVVPDATDALANGGFVARSDLGLAATTVVPLSPPVGSVDPFRGAYSGRRRWANQSLTVNIHDGNDRPGNAVRAEELHSLTYAAA
ncbi:hypothetical protein [Nocardia sp. bgisy134]|uniref:hypothetical protein n=1 Tax=Nocardia sp. bgisy134 TaxID=3413789 RepID=UPI003D72F261